MMYVGLAVLLALVLLTIMASANSTAVRGAASLKNTYFIVNYKFVHLQHSVDSYMILRYQTFLKTLKFISGETS